MRQHKNWRLVLVQLQGRRRQRVGQGQVNFYFAIAMHNVLHNMAEYFATLYSILQPPLSHL
jgi:hypothetical protein